jgi:hypothetical protein
MAKCTDCGLDMLTADGCTMENIETKGKSYKRIKCGDAGDWGEDEGAGYVCHDCNAKPGHYHHLGCDTERCPKCGGQLISCGCFDY